MDVDSVDDSCTFNHAKDTGVQPEIQVGGQTVKLSEVS